MSDFEEDLDDFPMFPAENISKTSNLWWMHIAQTQKINEQLYVESLRKFHHSVVGQLLSSSMRSWSMIDWILQCLKQENEDQDWRTDLLERRSWTRDFSIEKLWEQKMESSYFKDTWRSHFIRRAQSSSRDVFDLSEQGGWTLRWSSGSASSHCSWSVWEMLGWTCYRYPP